MADASRSSSRRIGALQGEKTACDTLVLWGERGVVHRLFKPVALLQAQCRGSVSGQLLPAEHFIPEERPADTAAALRACIRAGPGCPAESRFVPTSGPPMKQRTLGTRSATPPNV